MPHAFHPVVGGAEFLCRRVGEELASAGHEVVVATGNLANAEGFYLRGVSKVGPQNETIGGVRVVRLPVDRRVPPRNGRSYPLFRKGLAALIREFAPDVVMTMPHLFANVRVVLELETRYRFPLVLAPLLHEHDPAWPFEEVANAVGRAGAVVALTRHEGGRLVEAYKVDPQKVVVTRVGVDLPEKPGAHPRSPDVLILGRQTPSKGLPVLLAAMSIVWTVIPEARLLIAGPSVPGFDEPHRLLSDLPPERRSKVRNFGEVDEATKNRLLMEAACVAVPSPRESFGMVVLEAWARATPVVAIATPVLSETIHDGSDGLLTPSEPSGLAIAILALLGDPALAEAMGKAGRARVEHAYRWPDIAERFLTAYEIAIAGKR